MTRKTPEDSALDIYNLLETSNRSSFRTDIQCIAECIKLHCQQAVEEALKPYMWQPIETAPKDERIRLWKEQEYIGQWVENPWTGETAWSIADLGEGYKALLVGPTHWAHLLPSPKKGAKP